jgi:hypothetical protein
MNSDLLTKILSERFARRLAAMAARAGMADRQYVDTADRRRGLSGRDGGFEPDVRPKPWKFQLTPNRPEMATIGAFHCS